MKVWVEGEVRGAGSGYRFRVWLASDQLSCSHSRLPNTGSTGSRTHTRLRSCATQSSTTGVLHAVVSSSERVQICQTCQLWQGLTLQLSRWT